MENLALAETNLWVLTSEEMTEPVHKKCFYTQTERTDWLGNIILICPPKINSMKMCNSYDMKAVTAQSV
jgi:hypothetical protein